MVTYICYEVTVSHPLVGGRGRLPLRQRSTGATSPSRGEVSLTLAAHCDCQGPFVLLISHKESIPTHRQLTGEARVEDAHRCGRVQGAPIIVTYSTITHI